MALDRLFTFPGYLAKDPDFGPLQNQWALNAPMPQSMRDKLAVQGLTAVEIDHIDSWPSTEKEKVRVALVEAILSNRSVVFFWELYPGASSVSDVQNTGTGNIIVTNRTPRDRVSLSSLNLNEVSIQP